MNRAMFSGVAGMKAHQTKMDTIGNNIANVNTYGYKSQRAVFSDIYYQSLRGATAGTANRGGQNPSMVGYGSNLSAVQSQMTQSSMQNTGFGLDVAITGEGFLQVQDADGNIFYTKAGLLSYDSNGYLTDINGNFVLGTKGNGDPDTQKIKLDDVGSVSAKAPAVTQVINGTSYTFQFSNSTAKGNVSLNIGTSDSLPIGKKAQAVMSAGSINILLNSKEIFESMADLQNAINDAITEANNGIQHDGGILSITTDEEQNWGDGLTGAQIVGDNFGYDQGSITLPDNGKIFGGFSFDSVGNGFELLDNDDLSFSLERDPDSGDLTIKATTSQSNKEYSATIRKTEMTTPGKVVLSVANGDTTDTITLNFPNYNEVLNVGEGLTWNPETFDDGSSYGGFSLVSPGNLDKNDITGANMTLEALTGVDEGKFLLTMTVNGTNYTHTFDKKQAGKQLFMDDGTGNGFTLKAPSMNNMLSSAATMTFNPVQVLADDIVNSQPSSDLGFGSKSFAMTGGTEGGVVTLDQLSSISIGSDGTISVYHAEKGTVVAGKITLANFANPYGLEQGGNNYFTATSNSGDPQLAEPGSDGTGALKSSSLEMSNVDLSGEFADMITTQRGFQANSRIITVSDTMLEELINLKR